MATTRQSITIFGIYSYFSSGRHPARVICVSHICLMCLSPDPWLRPPPCRQGFASASLPTHSVRVRACVRACEYMYVFKHSHALACKKRCVSVCACIQPHTRTSMQKEGVAGEPGAQRRTRSTACKLWPEELAIFGEKVAGLLAGTATHRGGKHPA